MLLNLSQVQARQEDGIVSYRLCLPEECYLITATDKKIWYRIFLGVSSMERGWLFSFFDGSAL